MRKVIQIAVTSGRYEDHDGERLADEIPAGLFALCDDGSIWINQRELSYPFGWFGWLRFEDVPKDRKEEEAQCAKIAEKLEAFR